MNFYAILFDLNIVFLQPRLRVRLLGIGTVRVGLRISLCTAGG